MTLRMLRCMAVLVSFCPLWAFAEDWTEFRGPTGQGHSTATGLPVHWSDTENVRWKVDVPGKGWSSPIVLNGRIYLTTAVLPEGGMGNDRSLRALCLDSASGKTIWDVEVFNQTDADTHAHGKNSHASPTPITDGQHVYVHFGTKGTACLTLDGRVVWRNRELLYDPRHGSGGSPILVDDSLVVSCDGHDVQFVAALDRKTGEIRWKKERPSSDSIKKFAFCTPLFIEAGGRRQIVSVGANSVVAYDPAGGNEIWMLRHAGYSTIPRPVFAHGLVYVCTSFDQSRLLAIRPDGRGDVSDTHVEWESQRGAPHSPSLLVVGDDLYAISDKGILSCFEAETGDVRWTHRVGGNFSASPLFADGKIYLQSEEGVGTVFAPGAEYKELARNDMQAPSLASYAVDGSALLIRTEGQLFRIEER